MNDLMRKLQRTTHAKLPIVLRILAGGPLLAFSIVHFTNPDNFRDILTASGIPFVDLNVLAASATELLAGLLLLSGFLTRIGGLLGAATMLPAIYSTVTLMRMTPDDLPGGMTEVPSVPPLPLPVVVLIAAIIVVIVGGGRLSVDRMMSRQSETGDATGR